MGDGWRVWWDGWCGGLGEGAARRLKITEKSMSGTASEVTKLGSPLTELSSRVVSRASSVGLMHAGWNGFETDPLVRTEPVAAAVVVAAATVITAPLSTLCEGARGD